MAEPSKEFAYDTSDSGACCTQIRVRLEGDVIRGVVFESGCWGNHRGIEALVRGRRVGEVIPLLKGIQCQNGTSCPDQLALALLAAAKKA